MSRSTRDGLLALPALALFVVLAVSSLRARSATFDEGVYISAGYSHLVAGDYRLIPVHPPLAKLLAAAPLVVAGARADFRDDSWRQADPWSFAHRFVYRWNDADHVLLLARLPIVALAAGLAYGVFWWTRLHWGRASAFLALLLCILSPEMLAHGALSTSDLAVAFFVFHAVVAFERLTESVTWSRVLAAGLATGGAFVAKFSGLVLVPILLALAVVVAVGPWPLRLDLKGWPGGPRDVVARSARAAHLLGLLVLLGALSLTVIWGAYRFRYPAGGDPSAPQVLSWRDEVSSDPVPVAARFVREHHLLPEAYVFGFADTLRRSKGRPSFLQGRRSDEGWPYFFPVAFALKTPLALSLLLLMALIAGWRVAAAPRVELFVLVPATIYIAFCLSSHVNLGLRYLLPLYPFLFVFAARTARLAVRSRAWAAPVVILAVWYAVSVLCVHPYYLAYFNEAAGGPRQGYRHLVDSSLDWGQDLKGLKTYLVRNRIPRIKLSYFGTADPRYYGIPCDYLPGSMRPAPERLVLFVRPGDLVVVSATNLQGVYLPPAMRPLMERLRSSAPIATIGHTLFVYRADFDWLVPPADAYELGWSEHALESYAEASRLDPSSAEPHGHLGLTWHMLGRNRRAAAAFEEALRRDPAYLESRPEHRRAWQAALAALQRRPGT